MATVNLGAIKFNWKGAYSNSTAYAVDDVVSSGGSSYVCIQAHTNQPVGNATAYWNIMSSAGTNGTDVGTTLTTQGDILYRDGSGLQRLAKPSSNKILQNTSGGVLSYIDAPVGGLVQVKYVRIEADQTLSATSFNDLTGITLNITPTSASNKIFVLATVQASIPAGNRGWKTRIMRGSTSVHEEAGQKATYSSTNLIKLMSTYQFLDSPNTTSATTYKIQVQQDGGSAINYQEDGWSTLTLMEVSV